MRFSEFVINEGIAQVFKSFDDWAKAVRKAGAKMLVKSADKRKRIAVNDAGQETPSLHRFKKFGEWDEKHEEGWVYDIRKTVEKIELAIDTAVPLREGDISDSIPYGKNEQIRKLIKKGAMDPTHNWVNALDLIHRAYEMADVERPNPAMDEAWSQYEDNIEFAVQMLQKATDKGIRDDSWKSQTVSS